MIFNNKRQK